MSSLTIPWWELRLCALDLETTHPEPEEARIVSFAVVLAGGGRPTETLTCIVDPGVPIPPEATGVHGITDAIVGERGVPAAEAIPGVLSVLRAAHPPAPLIVFNGRYDLTVLDREARRHGLEPLDPRPVIDPLVIDKHLWRYRKGSRKLDAICLQRGAVLDGAHDASFDALAAARLAWVIGAKGEVIRRVRDAREEAELQALQAEWDEVRADAAALHDAQIRWAAAQASSLRDYFISEGQMENAAEVREEWPVIPAGDLQPEGSTA